MSVILNQKEQVLSFELTKYGRKLLSTGNLKPHFFSFFDDSIFYDYSYCTEQEDSNSIQDRILNESLTFGLVNKLEDTLENPLGSSDIFNDYTPAWDLQVLNGKINYISSSSTFYKKIFKFDDVIYTIQFDNEKDKNLIIKDDYILIDLKELNIQDDIENFEVEIVTYDELSGGKDAGLERKLFFHPKRTNIIDDIIYDSSELPLMFFETNITTDDVKYYLDILVDEEIDEDFIVTMKKKLQEKLQDNYESLYDGPTEPC